MPEIPFHEFKTAGALAMSLADEIGRHLRYAVEAREAASLVVPGGKSPQLFFEKLRAQPLPWSGVQVTLTDERWVPVNDKQSNERFVRSTLMSKGMPAANARLIGFMNNAQTPVEGAEVVERELMRMARPFDVVLVGMGDDGHIASLFPGTEGSWIDPQGRVGCEADRAPDGSWRVTQTLAALLTGRHVMLLISGEQKQKILERALNDGPEKGPPVAALMCQDKVPIEVWWAP